MTKRTQMGWNDYANYNLNNYGYMGMHSDPITSTCRVETESERRVYYSFDEPPFWLRIGPITWEGKY